MRVNRKVMNVIAKAMVMVMLMELIMVIVINQQWSNVTSHRTNLSRPEGCHLFRSWIGGL